MAIPLRAILDSLEKIPYFPPPSDEVTLAIVNDALRTLGSHPLSESDFTDPTSGLRSGDLQALSYLAFLMKLTALGPALTKEKIEATGTPKRLRAFLDSLAGVPLETLPKNAFRREELLRKWLHAFGLSIEGEIAERSLARLDAVDYHRLKKAMARQEEERKRIAAEWARKQAEAAAAAAAAAASQSSGSYE